MNWKWAVAICVLVLHSEHSSFAATFEILGRISRPYGEKTVFVSDDGSTVLATLPGGGYTPGFQWHEPEGIVGSIPLNPSFWPRGISGDGKKVVGLHFGYGYYPDDEEIVDASYDGS